MYKKRTSIVPILCSIAVALLIFACEDNSGDTPSHGYVCDNGTKAGGSANSAGVTKCSACNDGYLLVSEDCKTFTVTVERNGSPTINSVSINATASHDATLHWVVYAGGTTKTDAATVISDAASDSAATVAGRSGTDGIMLTGGTAEPIAISQLNFDTDYVLYAAISSGKSRALSSALEFKTAKLDGLGFYNQPAATNTTQTTTDITLTASKDANLYWVLYDSPQTLSVANLKNAATTSGGAFRSGATADTVTANAKKQLTIGSATDPLAAKQSYYFYALLEDGENQALSTELKFSTVGYDYVCANGNKADGQAAAPNTNQCKDCKGGFTLYNGACIPQGPFTRHANGITIICAGADDGDTGVVDGVIYTKRNRDQILNDRALAVTSCTSGIANMSELFKDTDYNGDIAHWDTSSVTNMRSMFSKNKAFVTDINKWDVSKVTDMYQMFLGDKGDSNKGSNPNISSWDTGEVRNMEDMFKENATFNQDISKWDVSNVTNMAGMFRVATSFNADIGDWDVRKVGKSSMGNMFRSASAFSYDIREWCVSQYTDGKPGDFDTSTSTSTWPQANKPKWGTAAGNNCQVNYTNQPSLLSKGADDATVQLTPSENATLYWVLRTTAATYGNSTLLKEDIGGTGIIKDSGSDGEAVADDMPYDIMLDTLTAQNTYYLYTALEVVVDGALVESAVSEQLAFVTACNDGYVEINNECVEVKTFTETSNGIITCAGFDVDTPGIINGDSSTVYVKRAKDQINTTNAATTCTTDIIDMSDLFKNTDFNGDISHWDTSTVTNMSGMFYNADDFTHDITKWDVSMVENMDGMFRDNDNFNQDISDWNIASLVNMNNMFRNADAFDQNIGKWDVSTVTTMGSTFRHNAAFNQDIGSWNTAMVTDMNNMFRDAIAFNQDIGNWDVSKVNRDKMHEMFRGASVFSQNISQWCVSHIDDDNGPSDFDRSTDSTTWPDENKPQWNTAQGNNCDINFTSQPTASDITATAATISLTASKGATLHWILYTNKATHLDSGILKTAIGNSNGVRRSVDAGVVAGDDSAVTIELTMLTGSTPYFFYSALEVVDNDNNVAESVLSEELSFTTLKGHSCGDYEKLDTDGTTCIATVYTCTNGTFDTTYNNQTPEGNEESNTVSDVQKCNGCDTGYGMNGDACTTLYNYICPNGNHATGGDVVQNTIKCTGCGTNYGLVDEVCVALQNFSVSASGIISCDGFAVGTPGIINNDQNTIYVKRTKDQINTTNAATSCTTGIADMGGMFTATAVDVNNDGDTDDAVDYPAVSGAADFNGNITHWDTSSVTNMSNMFNGNIAFTKDLSNWDVSKVTDMSRMFRGPYQNGSAGSNPVISGWDTGMVENMSAMFNQNGMFTGEIGGWDVSNATNMSSMFRVAIAFNADIGDWDISKVSRSNMSNMLRTASAFTQDISDWCVSHIEEKPVDFDNDISTMNWPDEKRPQWDTAAGNSCEVNFTSQPTASETDDVNGTATIQLTASEGATLYWVLRTSPITYNNSTALTDDIGSSSNVQDSGSDGEAVLDDEVHNVMLEDLPIGNTYFFYAALEVVDDGTVVESAISAEHSFAVGCASGFFDVDNECKQLKSFTVSDDGIVSCANFDVGTPGFVTGTETIYVKRDRSEILADRDRAITACTSDITNMSSLFANTDFNSDISHWDTSSVTDMSNMFDSAASFNKNIGAWDVSSVTNMSNMFNGATSFDQGINNWDVSDVDNMEGMFDGATGFNRNISDWDVSDVDNMKTMFRFATSFNQDISDWDVSNVDDMFSMFEGATSFNANIGGWDVGNVSKSKMEYMLRGATAFTQDISEWCVPHINGKPYRFDLDTDSLAWPGTKKPQWKTTQGDNCQLNFVSQPAVSAKTATTATVSLTPSEGVTLYWILRTTPTTYANSAALRTDIGGTSDDIVDDSGASGVAVTDDTEYDIMLDPLAVQTTYYLYAALVLVDDSSTLLESAVSEPLQFVTECNADSLEVNNVCRVIQDFTRSATTGIITCDGFDIDTPGIINGDDTKVYIKRDKDQITTANAATSCTTGITDMSNLFKDVANFNEDITHWDTSSVTNMQAMFSKNKDFTQNISNWDVSKVTNMSQMFIGPNADGSEGSNPNISGWDTGMVTNMKDMFKENGNFNGGISGWDVSSVTTMEGMFRAAKAFNTDISSWNVGNVTRAGMKNMFRTATAFTQDISQWCVSLIKSEPTDFDRDVSTNTWPAGNKPQWNTSRGNNCPINFIAQPVFDSADNTVALTASEVGKLYWILYSSDTTLANVAALKTAIGTAGVGVQKSAVAGEASMDDVAQDVTLTTLDAGTYYFYAGLAVEETDGTIIESEISNKIMITIQ